MTYKCEKCGYEWNARVERPQRCAECDSRQVERIDRGTPVVSATIPPGFHDSVVVAPGMYMLCDAHGRRYCIECGTAAKGPVVELPGIGKRVENGYTPEQWTVAYAKIQASKPKKEGRNAESPRV